MSSWRGGVPFRCAAVLLGSFLLAAAPGFPSAPAAAAGSAPTPAAVPAAAPGPVPPTAAAPASGADRERARELGYSGVRAFGRGEYAAASEQLEQSFELLQVPSLGLWSARALVQLGKLLEAEARYRVVSQLAVPEGAPQPQLDAKATAELELQELSPRIPSLRIAVSGADLERVAISVDGVPVPAGWGRHPERINPGRHTITATRGRDRSDLVLILGEGQHEEAHLHFSEPVGAASAVVVPPGTERAWRTGGYVGLGTGGALLATSVVSYFLGKKEQESLDCSGSVCDPSEDLGTYDTLRTVQISSLIAGSLFGAAGLAILIIAPGESSSSDAEVALRLNRRGAALRVQF